MKKHMVFAAGAGVAAVAFQGAFLSGCGSMNICAVRQPDGSYANVCEQDAAEDADAASDASKDASDSGSDAATDASSDASGDAPSDAASDAPPDAG